MIDTHKASVGSPPKSWGVSEHDSDTQQFWCGFCSSYLRTTWKSWINHLADHYTIDNYDMTRWNPETSFSIEYPMSTPAANPDLDVAENLNLDGAADPNVYGTTNLNFDSLLDDAAPPNFDDITPFNSSDAPKPEFDSNGNPNFDSFTLQW